MRGRVSRVVRAVVGIAVFMAQGSFAERAPATSDAVTGARIIDLRGGSEREAKNPSVLLPLGVKHLRQRTIVQYGCASGGPLICDCPGRANGLCKCKC
jgi:hypothetical protein